MPSTPFSNNKFKMLEIINLSMCFPHGSEKIEILNDVNLQVKTGETVAITGGSGSGKTTLLSLIAGLNTPTLGKVIYFNKTSINELTENELSIFRGQNIGFIFQDYYLLPHLNVLENIALPLDILNAKKSRERANIALSRVGLNHREKFLPTKLSGGESQRVAIARALVSNPKIILADEPTGNLDYKTAENIKKLLFENVKEQKTSMVLVTHDRNFAKDCDRHLELVRGKLCES